MAQSKNLKNTEKPKKTKTTKSAEPNMTETELRDILNEIQHSLDTVPPEYTKPILVKCGKAFVDPNDVSAIIRVRVDLWIVS